MDEPESDRVAALLRSLANPVRLDLLRALRTPRILSELRVDARRGAGGRAHPVNRVTVRRHLASLLEAGVVRVRPLQRGGRARRHYLVDPRELFALADTMLGLARLQPEEEWLDPTRPTPASAGPAQSPALVLVNGPHEGRWFPLRGAGWSLGRRAGHTVCLDYDPYVSLDHARLERSGAVFRLTDLGSRNGLSVNWAPVPPGGDVDLEPGDVVRLGRSNLLLR